MTEDKNAYQRGRRVLVTHDRLAGEAVALLQANDVDVIFSPAYAPPDQVACRVAEFEVDALIVRQGRVTQSVIDASPRLRVIAKHGVGVDNIDLHAAAARNIPVVRGMGSNSQAVAELTITLALALLKEVPWLDAAVKRGEWPKPTFIGRDIGDTVLGLVGFGSIGQHVARMARGLGMQVLIHDPHARAAIGAFDTASERELDALLRESDLVSLHCPLTPETLHLLDRERIALMKRGACVINTARGPLIDEEALAEALFSGQLGGAGLDSFAQEPPAAGNTLWRAPNLIATPHIAGVTAGASRAMAHMAARQVIDILDGHAPDAHNLVRVAELATE